ncbi:MAG TPA: hypothetical protein VF843_12140, partial [Streptosporangiaceae bacterium]
VSVLRCVDGSLLGVAAVPCCDRVGLPYDLTLRLTLDRQPFATVGQRCRAPLATLSARVRAAIDDPDQASGWPDPDDRFPVPRARVAPSRLQPGEREYFTLRSRDRSDLPGGGEVRCVLRSSAQWHGGQWALSRRAVVEAWGDRGTGVRAVLTSAELVTFLDTVLSGQDGAMMARTPPAAGSTAAAGDQAGRITWSSWRQPRQQRGRVPDESARSRLPALRAAARNLAFAVGGPEARGSDVRR